MSNNVFSRKRFSLLCRQHFFQNGRILLLSTAAYAGVIFIVLSLIQLSQNLEPHNLDSFQVCLAGFVVVFGMLYVGHSFPAFRSKESTINYLMVPASAIEKFVFEFMSRIGMMILILPITYWMTFHLQGYLFTMFTEKAFHPVSINYLVWLDVSPEDAPLVYTIVAGGSLLALVVAFTGSVMFTKQPLVRTLFSVALVVMFFVFYSYVVLTHLGVETYRPPETIWLLPEDETGALQLVSVLLLLAIVVMLYVAFRKLKEKEV